VARAVRRDLLDDCTQPTPDVVADFKVVAPRKKLEAPEAATGKTLQARAASGTCGKSLGLLSTPTD
jgi:hypothetical protein